MHPWDGELLFFSRYFSALLHFRIFNTLKRLTFFHPSHASADEMVAKNKICSKCIWPETWILFQALNNIRFRPVFGKRLRNNALPTILSISPLLLPTSPALFTLVRRPRWRIGHLARVDVPAASPALPCHLRWHADRVAYVRSHGVPSISGIFSLAGILGTGLSFYGV